MARRTLTDSQIANLKVSKRKNIADPGLAGHYLRVTPNGAKSFWVVARDPSGHQHWKKIGDCAHTKLDAAREEARRVIGAIKVGADTAGPETFATVASGFVELMAERGVITLANKERYLRNHILPAWSGRDFRTIKRSDVVKLMDVVAKKAGPVAADECLSIIRSICTWFATRNDDYVSPIIRGMRRTSNKDRARDRVLTDEEIRSLFMSQATTPMLPIAKLLLLTGQRRTKVASMTWDAITIDGAWHVSNGSKREKGTGGELMLPEMALDIIKAQPRFVSSHFVFPAARGAGHFKAYTDGKALIGGEWRLHDLRRTAKSLMARAGVHAHISERVLGHEMGGVEGIYDRHSYREEKAHALKALAGLLETIIRGPVDNLVALRR
jgi:integrase